MVLLLLLVLLLLRGVLVLVRLVRRRSQRLCLLLLLLSLLLQWPFLRDLLGLRPLGRRGRWTTKARLLFRGQEGEHVFRSSQEGGALHHLFFDAHHRRWRN